jgi:ABC-type molybdate transport system substrate-binding protein
LNAAFTDIVAAFPAAAGDVAAPVFGPSGVLRERIERGDHVDVFASADMDQPRRLARTRSGSFVAMFVRNRLCALGRAKIGLTSDNLLDRLLDPSVRLATSTPGADPGGDYAWAVFARAEAVHRGAQAMLQQKAMQLVGGPNSKPLVPLVIDNDRSFRIDGPWVGLGARFDVCETGCDEKVRGHAEHRVT